MNVLVSSAGRRVGLIECFRESLERLGIRGRILAADATPYAAAGQLADAFFVVPRCGDPAFVPEILNICEREQVALIVPTIDTELPVYAATRGQFSSAGVAVALSHRDAVQICQDKIITHSWLTAHGFPVPRQATSNEILCADFDWEFPVVAKPVGGSASVGVQFLTCRDELRTLIASRSDLIVQEAVQGREYTINVYVSRSGKCLCAVPHLRIETRGGEVSKGVTVKNRVLMQTASRLVEALPGAYGALNVQCFLTPGDELKVIEVNARFGGGYPLAHRAGAVMARWLIQETCGHEPDASFDAWTDGLAMLRYDEAVYISERQLKAISDGSALHRLRS